MCPVHRPIVPGTFRGPLAGARYFFVWSFVPAKSRCIPRCAGLSCVSSLVACDPFSSAVRAESSGSSSRCITPIKLLKRLEAEVLLLNIVGTLEISFIGLGSRSSSGKVGANIPPRGGAYYLWMNRTKMKVGASSPPFDGAGGTLGDTYFPPTRAAV